MYFDVVPKERKEDFYNRKKELGDFLEAVNLKERLIIVYGIRRIGKSSLVRVALNELQQPFILIDVREIYFRANTITDQYLVESIVNNFVKHMKWYEKIGFNIKEALKRIKKIRVRDYEIEIEPSSRIPLTLLLSEINSWCEKHGLRFILVLDEAQYLRYSNTRYDGIIAWTIDNLEHITIVLTGSEVGVLRDFLRIEDPKAPLFGRYRREIYLDRFNSIQSQEFLKTGFKQLGLEISEEEINDTVSLLDGVVGWLTYYGYYRGIRRISHKEALNKVFQEGSKLILEELGRIIAPSKRRYLAILKAIALGLTRWSEIKAYVTAKIGYINDKRFTELLRKLVKYGYIAKINNEYHIIDPVVRETCKKAEM